MIKDRTGQRYGRLVAVSYVKRSKWVCHCDCGATVIVGVSNLEYGSTQSCGCLRRETNAARFRKHGMFGTRTHTSWRAMMQRCYDPNNRRYADWGGRGIKVYPGWHTFEGFYADVGDRPEDRTLDRPRVNEDYGPTNWRWATVAEQNRNKRNSLRSADHEDRI
jgi:hypothetical protein